MKPVPAGAEGPAPGGLVGTLGSVPGRECGSAGQEALTGRKVRPGIALTSSPADRTHRRSWHPQRLGVSFRTGPRNPKRVTAPSTVSADTVASKPTLLSAAAVASSRPMDPTKWSQSKAGSPVSLTNMSGLVPGAGDDGEPYIASVPTPRPPPVRFKLPETYGRRFLEKRIAYQLQEIEFRKVNPELFERNRERIEALIKAGESKKPERGVRVMPGTVLTREYQGVEHRITVTLDGR